MRPNPNLGEGYYEDNTQNTVYTSWQTSVRKRYSRNLSGASTTPGAKACPPAAAISEDITRATPTCGLRTSSIPGRPRSFLRRHRALFRGRVSSTICRGSDRRNAFLRYAAGGWQVSGMLTAMSGQPLLITQSSSLQVTRPDYVGGPAILAGSRDTLQYLNRAAFALVPISSVSGASIRPGNVGNGAVRGPGLQNLDFSLAKNVRDHREIEAATARQTRSIS